MDDIVGTGTKGDPWILHTPPGMDGREIEISVLRAGARVPLRATIAARPADG